MVPLDFRKVRQVTSTSLSLGSSGNNCLREAIPGILGFFLPLPAFFIVTCLLTPYCRFQQCFWAYNNVSGPITMLNGARAPPKVGKQCFRSPNNVIAGNPLLAAAGG